MSVEQNRLIFKVEGYEYYLHWRRQSNGLDELGPLKRLLKGSTVTNINQIEAKKLYIDQLGQ